MKDVEEFYYVYILRSLTNENRTYIGLTKNLRQRLSDHNRGKSEYTKKFIPWKIQSYIAFECLNKAREFEQYLKKGSGRAFLNRHF